MDFIALCSKSNLLFKSSGRKNKGPDRGPEGGPEGASDGVQKGVQIERSTFCTDLPGTMKEFDTKNPLNFARRRQLLLSRSKKLRNISRKKNSTTYICMTVV